MIIGEDKPNFTRTVSVNDPMRFSSLKKLNEMKYFVFPATKMNLQRLRLGQSLLFFSTDFLRDSTILSLLSSFCNF